MLPASSASQNVSYAASLAENRIVASNERFWPPNRTWLDNSHRRMSIKETYLVRRLQRSVSIETQARWRGRRRLTLRPCEKPILAIITARARKPAGDTCPRISGLSAPFEFARRRPALLPD